MPASLHRSASSAPERPCVLSTWKHVCITNQMSYPAVKDNAWRSLELWSTGHPFCLPMSLPARSIPIPEVKSWAFSNDSTPKATPSCSSPTNRISRCMPTASFISATARSNATNRFRTQNGFFLHNRQLHFCEFLAKCYLGKAVQDQFL